MDQKPPRKKGDKPRIKFASAHDLRRTFGERWADGVDAQVLMELMRHEDIETTLRFYVGRNARRTSRALWRVYNRELEERAKLAGDGSEKAIEAASESPENGNLCSSLYSSDVNSVCDCGSRNDTSPSD